MTCTGHASLPGSRKAIDPATVVRLREAGLTHKQIATRLRTNLTRVGAILKQAGTSERQADKEL